MKEKKHIVLIFKYAFGEIHEETLLFYLMIIININADIKDEELIMFSSPEFRSQQEQMRAVLRSFYFENQHPS